MPVSRPLQQDYRGGRGWPRAPDLDQEPQCIWGEQAMSRSGDGSWAVEASRVLAEFRTPRMSWRERPSVALGIGRSLCWHPCPGGGQKVGDGAGRGLGGGVAQLATGSPPPGATPQLRVCTRARWSSGGRGAGRVCSFSPSTHERRRQLPEDVRQQDLALAVIPPATLWAVTVAAASLLCCLYFDCAGPSLPCTGFLDCAESELLFAAVLRLLCCRAQALTAGERSCGGARAGLLCGMWGLSSWTSD